MRIFSSAKQIIQTSHLHINSTIVVSSPCTSIYLYLFTHKNRYLSLNEREAALSYFLFKKRQAKQTVSIFTLDFRNEGYKYENLLDKGAPD